MCFCSYIVPVYNVFPEYLQQCLDSILCEKDIPIEVILVDDASSNGCERLCDDYAAKDARVKAHHLVLNKGASNARNTGIQLSTGEWIVFVDSDDWVETNISRRLSEEACDDVDVIVFSAYKDKPNESIPYGTAEKKTIFSISQGDLKVHEICDHLLKQSLQSTHPMYDTVKYTMGKAYRREFLLKNNILFSKLDYCEDIVFTMGAFRKAQKVIQLPDRFYHYRDSQTSVVNSYRVNITNEQHEFLRLLEAECDSRDSIYYAALLSMQICIARFFFHKENPSNLIAKHKNARRCFSEWPYTDVFKYVDISNMKRKEKLKALLIKYRMYYFYYLGTQARGKKVATFR